MYLIINSEVDLHSLAETLHVSTEDVEAMYEAVLASPNLGFTIDARLDPTQKVVTVMPPSSSVYGEVMEKTRDVTNRTSLLASNIASVLLDQSNFVKARQYHLA